MKPSARRSAREYALQAMYQWQISKTPLSDLELQFLTHEIKKKTDLDYFKELMFNIPKQCDELDQIITPFLDRSLEDLDQVELAVLHIATYELKNRLEIPYRVIINEALELTKKFGSIEGYKFVNGVMDKIARKIRATEMTAKK